MIDFHLLGIVFFQPLVLLTVVVDEAYGNLLLYLNGGLAAFAVVEPCLDPPSDARTVGIDADNPWNVKALHVNLQSSQRIDESAGGYGFFKSFFFTSSLMLERNTC